MQFPKPSPRLADVLETAVSAADVPGVSVDYKPMFGCPAWFTNGNMFAGVFGDGINVRLDDEGRAELTEIGGTPFEPMAGRPMREYVVLPATMTEDAEAVAVWVRRALAYAAALPPKAPKKRRAKRGT
jgi:TfoX/Sxy family transcriptional regulator of competence genes